MSTPTEAGTGYAFPGPPPASYGPPPPPPAPPAATTGRSRQHVVWGVLGAVVASAVWAGAVVTVPSLVTTGSKAPGIGSYRVVDNLCVTARFNRFTQLYPAQSGTPYHYSTRHSAMDDMYCSEYVKKNTTDAEYSSLYVEAQLHKAVDPQREFEAQRSSLQQRRYQITEVPNLGQQSYVGYLDDPSNSDRTWHYLTQVLYVRDGGLTYYLSWSGSYQEGKTTPPDRETIRQALVMDTRDILRAIGG